MLIIQHCNLIGRIWNVIRPVMQEVLVPRFTGQASFLCRRHRATFPREWILQGKCKHFHPEELACRSHRVSQNHVVFCLSTQRACLWTIGHRTTKDTQGTLGHRRVNARKPRMDESPVVFMAIKTSEI